MQAKNLFKLFCYFIVMVFSIDVFGDNQTDTVSPVFVNSRLPFRIDVERAGFDLPVGLQSFSLGLYKDKWVFIGGRVNGLHGFADTNNFPPNLQNTDIYVFDLKTKSTKSRSLNDPDSGLTQDMVESISATAQQFYQKGNTLYIAGGYGTNGPGADDFTTFSTLSAIDVPGLIDWVYGENSSGTVVQYIRQIQDPVFAVTGGLMTQIEEGPTLLVFGQSFDGQYNVENPPPSVQQYTFEVRRFNIFDDGQNLSVEVLPATPKENFARRRDLNIVATVKKQKGHNVYGLSALSGVFTPSNGAWTVPVEIDSDGSFSMADPNYPGTFKQAMNNYISSVISLFSDSEGSTYIVLLGGITFGYFENGECKTDSGFPFTSQVTTVRIDKDGNYTQHLMDTEFPAIKSIGTNPGNRLLFGAGSAFIPKELVLVDKNAFRFPKGSFRLDDINTPKLAGYVVGGIMSTLPDTEKMSDSSASPYIFKIQLTPIFYSSISNAINKKYCSPNGKVCF